MKNALPPLEPPPLEPGRHALFLDFDGTLIAFAETPDGIEVSDDLHMLIDGISERFAGAMAFVTGRGIANLRSHIGERRIAMAGAHGAEWSIDGQAHETLKGEGFDDQLTAVAAFAALHDALVMEVKSGGLTLHYRRKPELEADVFAIVEQAFAGRDDFHIMPGHMMVEARRAQADKGKAIERFMKSAPFRGRVPVFLGDDVTDEFGFAPVNALGGISVRVGPGETQARYRLPDIAAVHDYLGAALKTG
ncbi:trehalose-phosphatase [Pseudahrensia aquimaris]|uniref:Trehalose 6-phosphate phosphatase n=1 Tax=Pseudahrensia aquimaris TaxID=744461 RepID=A0ABW3FDG3_9HYPH